MEGFDPDLSGFFILFLAVFVLIGLVPFFRKSVRQWEELFRAQAGSGEGAQAAPGGKGRLAEQPPDRDLHGLEVLVFSRLAQGGKQGCTIRRLGRELVLDRSFVEKVLNSLRSKGLVRSAHILVFGTRHYLSKNGWRYAAERGFIAAGISPPPRKSATAGGRKALLEEGVQVRETNSGQ